MNFSTGDNDSTAMCGCELWKIPQVEEFITIYLLFHLSDK